MQHSILVGVDWGGLVWAAIMAALVSWANYRLALQVGQKRTLADIVADVIIGTTAGMVLAVVAPLVWPALHNFGAVTACACVGGAGGRRFYDFAVGAVIWFARLRLGMKDKDGDGGAKQP